MPNTVGALMRGVLAAALILVVPSLVLVGCTVSPSGDEAELGRLLDDVVAAGAPGVLVVMREDGKVRTEARGFADRSGSIRMRADERFRIGSITKTFVAALVLRLVEDGALRLDDTVEQWLPSLVPGGRAITVRDCSRTQRGCSTMSRTIASCAITIGGGSRKSSSLSQSSILLSGRPQGGASRTRARTTSCSA